MEPDTKRRTGPQTRVESGDNKPEPKVPARNAKQPSAILLSNSEKTPDLKMPASNVKKQEQKAPAPRSSRLESRLPADSVKHPELKVPASNVKKQEHKAPAPGISQLKSMLPAGGGRHPELKAPASNVKRQEQQAPATSPKQTGSTTRANRTEPSVREPQLDGTKKQGAGIVKQRDQQVLERTTKQPETKIPGIKVNPSESRAAASGAMFPKPREPISIKKQPESRIASTGMKQPGKNAACNLPAPRSPATVNTSISSAKTAINPKPPVSTNTVTGFKKLGLIQSLLKAVEDAGYTTPTPIQWKAIPHVLAGKDLLGCAQTGTGKTAAFALPILQHLVEKVTAGIQKSPSGGKSPLEKRRIRALILSPTRELAIQIEENFVVYEKYTGLKSTVIFGGVGQDPQVKALQSGVDVLVATPGRLLDLMGQGHVSINNVEIFVLDEADRMLDMGFIHDVRRVVKELPIKRQTLLFSATIPAEIVELAQSILNDPVEVRVSPEKVTLDEIAQSLYFVPKKQKVLLLIELLKDKKIIRALVFTRTKHGANQVVKKLVKAGIPALAIHGNKSQTARQKALGDFKQGDLRVLVATDVASRGIDVDNISHVIQYDLPNVPETYVHRIGRTGRMGAAGSAIAFCDDVEKDCLKDIEKFIKKRVPVVETHLFKP